MSIDDILTRLRAADLALAGVRGKTSELELLRVATGELLVAVHGLVKRQVGEGRASDAWEGEPPAEPALGRGRRWPAGSGSA